MLVFLTFVLAVLAAMGMLSIIRWLCNAISFSLKDEDAFFVVHLCGDAAHTEQTVKSCIHLRRERLVRGKLVFVDGGLSPEAQHVARMLLQKQEDALLCAESQLCEILKWERDDIGTGADQRQHRRDCL